MPTAPRLGARGFTTQEPWIPLIIVAILAMIAFVTLRRIGRESRIRIAVMHSLFMLAEAERGHHLSYHTYDPTLTITADSNAVVTVIRADSTGFVASATHPVIS